MKILLDTQALILAGNNSLPKVSADEFLDADNEIFFSVVSLWEMAIKKSLGKLDFNLSFDKYNDRLVETGLQSLALIPGHLQELSKLAWHHKDPFDRTLIAQAKYEQMAIMTGDKAFEKYGCNCIWEDSV